MQEIKSSIIQLITFLPKIGMLVTFRTGTNYLYRDISKKEYESIINDVSVGSKFKEVVKGRPCARVK